MPKQRKPRFSPEQIEAQSFFLRNQSPYPDNPELLKSLVSCLLKRTETLDESLGKSLRHLSKWLATLEEHSRLYPARKEANLQLTNCVLLLIAAGKLSRNSHWYYTLNAQLEWLRTYLKKSNFPPQGNNRLVAIQRQEHWIQTHGLAITRELFALPCMCNYTTLQDFQYTSVLNLDTGRPTIGKAAMAIVAFVHNTTVENIHKLTKPSNLPKSPSFQPLIHKLNDRLSARSLHR